MTEPEPKIEPLLVSVVDCAKTLSIGRSTVYKLIGSGELETRKIGNRTLVTMQSIRQAYNL